MDTKNCGPLSHLLQWYFMDCLPRLKTKTLISIFVALGLSALPASAYAFRCSIFEGGNASIPSFKVEIAELKNMHKSGRHVKLLIPRQGPVQEFNLDKFLRGATTDTQVLDKLKLVAGATVVYIDLYPVEKRYEIRMGQLSKNLAQVITPTVYANFAYNEQHNEVYDLQSNLAVFCN
ncbi:hypothetical protein A9R01_14080 ['Osedax' symbiont bacterium Rs2_46_30_T18]|nr:hypothetical protein A9R01_14080 ['Osedax' symbiont bacterium Rs2_46_30_T18]